MLANRSPTTPIQLRRTSERVHGSPILLPLQVCPVAVLTVLLPHGQTAASLASLVGGSPVYSDELPGTASTARCCVLQPVKYPCTKHYVECHAIPSLPLAPRQMSSPSVVLAKLFAPSFAGGDLPRVHLNMPHDPCAISSMLVQRASATRHSTKRQLMLGSVHPASGHIGPCACVLGGERTSLGLLLLALTGGRTGEPP